jgi:hypothetical protein
MKPQVKNLSSMFGDDPATGAPRALDDWKM